MDILGRILPQNIDAEGAIIAACLLEPDEIIPVVADMIRPEDFYSMENRAAFESILKLFNDGGEDIDIISVSNTLEATSKLNVCWIGHLSNVIDRLPTTAGTKHYCKIVKDKSQLREIIRACTSIADQAYIENDVNELARLIDSLQCELDARSGNIADTLSAVQKVKESLDERVNNPGVMPGIESGFDYWDYKTGGLINNLLYIIAARPSMGKTAFLLCVISFVCGFLKKPVLFFSLEMSKEQILNRLACIMTEIDSQKIKTGNLTPDEHKRINKAFDAISEWPLYIDDTPGLSLQDINARSRKVYSLHKNLGLICLDHLTEMQSGNDLRISVTENARGLKRLAKQLHIPFILLCQLNRGLEQRQNKRPCLSDLRESGAIEEVGDVISFLYRDNYYNPESDQREAELITAKNRDGRLGTTSLHWYGSVTKFKTPVLNPF